MTIQEYTKQYGTLAQRRKVVLTKAIATIESFGK